MKILTEWSGFQLLGLVFAGLLLMQGISRLRTRPNDSALWKPATFEKVDKAFALGLVDIVLACSLLTLASSISFLMCYFLFANGLLITILSLFSIKLTLVQQEIN